MNTNPIVKIELAKGGAIEIELFPDIAPNTVNNFIDLAGHGYYNDVIFHRVIPQFMIQGGDPQGTGGGGPGYSIKGEFASNGFKNDLRHERGVLSMARTPNPDSGGSQFFIMVADSPHLDGEYAAFGKVVSGMDYVDRIVSATRDGNDRPDEPESIRKIELDLKGKTYPEPERIA
jgi:peptidyl-prolyl cis-trans isomerase B (cyclophilin B)